MRRPPLKGVAAAAAAAAELSFDLDLLDDRPREEGVLELERLRLGEAAARGSAEEAAAAAAGEASGARRRLLERLEEDLVSLP